MGKYVKIPRRQGNKTIVESKYKARFIDGGKLCYGCNTVKNLDEYHKGATQCKSCRTKYEKKKWKKQKQPLW